ncbi:TonB-dependent siderophore receptor [Psychrobium sp. 1_MG-2023]|uniref:TonB-dependent receptor plug domain-containing protein n=1 Tax=Psychrobium sp. 1_MG-2023 TaxID=3062624 RepID=UPI000C3314D1|nr:TonB-dependent receptor [Psychrobium sp. 1_MG-2023]MDP2560968.1 TonB-dependent receptor [Psychrobium sp. 1_MG-2023]PKF54945.1 hypothetical protein CW748_14845 [Alteromonadales bacterium alter-6D02]
MFTNNKITKAVRIALIAGVASTSSVAFAADKNESTAEEVERVAVTGSRIQRTDMEGISPITVISREDLEVSGEVSVADVLRDSNFNSFGSSSESSGTGGGQQGIAGVSLRGLGADRSLVLVNGKRVAPSPAAGGGSANLNAIPMAAVDRIEIVSNGASAIYGSDAIGGVVNVILRKDYEGVSVAGAVGRPSQEGGDENQISLVMGVSGEKGSFVMSAEFSDREVIFSRDREYTKSAAGEKWADNTGISSNARNIRHLIDTDGDGGFDRIEWSALEDQCDTSLGFIGVQVREGSQPGTMCGYDYSKIAAETANLTNSSLYARGVYEVNDDVTFNLNTLATRTTSWGRFAPAAGNFNVTGTDMANDSVELADGESVVASRAYWRFTDNGPRDQRTDGSNFDMNMYLDGLTDWGTWTVGYHRNVANITNLGSGYINRPFAEQFAAEGTLTDERSIALMSHTISTFNKTDYASVNAGLGIDSLFTIGGNDVGAYFYAERTETTYVSQADDLSNASAVIGSAGGSAKGEREVTSLAAEFLFPLSDDLEVTLAARYDDFSDFGDNISPQLGATYNINDEWKLRASIGEGFRAPTFANLYSQSEGFPWLFVPGVGWGQYLTKTVGNEDLDAEKSDQFAFGIIGEIVDGVSFTLDYQRIEISDMISYESAANIWSKHQDGITLKPNTSITMIGNLPEELQATYINEGEMRAQFIDFDLRAVQETSFGEFRQNLAISYTLDYSTLEETSNADGETREVLLDQAGLRGLPQYRMNLGLAYIYEDHSITLTAKYIPTQLNRFELNENGTKYIASENDSAVSGQHTKIASYTDLDINYTWQAQDNLRLTVGARNLTNEDPRFRDVAESQYSSSLYSIQGRTVFAGFKYDF